MKEFKLNHQLDMQTRTPHPLFVLVPIAASRISLVRCNVNKTPPAEYIPFISIQIKDFSVRYIDHS